jgi:hypothetical protein
MQKLQHLDINTLGILWTRSPSNYESYSAVLAAMETINSDGSATLFKQPLRRFIPNGPVVPRVRSG